MAFSARASTSFFFVSSKFSRHSLGLIFAAVLMTAMCACASEQSGKLWINHKGRLIQQRSYIAGIALDRTEHTMALRRVNVYTSQDARIMVYIIPYAPSRRYRGVNVTLRARDNGKHRQNDGHGNTISSDVRICVATYRIFPTYR